QHRRCVIDGRPVRAHLLPRSLTQAPRRRATRALLRETREVSMSAGRPGRTRSGRWVFLVLFTLCSSRLVFAQTTGSSEGRVTDESGAALPGATVELAGPKLQGARSTTTATDGRYRFLSLTPGDYTVTASLPDLGRVQKRAIVTLDATSTADL